MSEKTLTRMDLSEAVFREVGLSRNESALLVESVLQHMSDALAAGESEDGFNPEPMRAAAVVVTLNRHHAADTDHDGKLSLMELTRVIELYNFRSGTMRTGDYRESDGTEDGFAPGP